MPIIKLPNGNMRDEIREPLFDTKDLAAGVVSTDKRTFFQDIQGKSLVQTNLRQSKQLETAVSFRIQGLAIDAHNFYSSDNMDQIIPLVMEQSALQLTVGEKLYWEGPMRFAAGRIYSDNAGKLNSVFNQHGGSSVATIILQGRHVVDVNPLQRFQVDWTMDAFTAAQTAIATVSADSRIRYVCSLKGIKRRPVQ